MVLLLCYWCDIQASYLMRRNEMTEEVFFLIQKFRMKKTTAKPKEH